MRNGMASDGESDVSAITLSDDDAPKQKPPTISKGTAQPGVGGAGGSSRSVSSGGTKAAAATTKAATKADRGKGRVAFKLPEPDIHEDDGDGSDEGYVNTRADQYAAGADGADDDAAVVDETKPLGWSYFRKRDASEGPVTWPEVDVDELRFVAENLVRSTTKRASQADDVMQQIFQAGPVDEDDFVTDPLGRGVIDPVTLALGKRSKMVKMAAPTKGEKGLKATMRTFRTARLSAKNLAGSEGAGGSGGAGAGGGGSGSRLDEEARKVLPNQEGFDPEAYLATFHSESSTGQLEKGLRSLSRELSERTGQLKLLIRNNFDRFINCKDAIDDIHSKMRKMALVRTGPAPSGGGGAAAAGGAGPAAAAQHQQQQQGVGTDRVFRSLEQVESQARRTFGPILDRAAKADRIRAVASLLQRFDHLFAAPQRVLELAGRGELEQVVREYHRANMLIRPTPTTARVWVSLYAEIEKRVTEVYLAVKQLVTETPPEGRPMGQDGPAVLFGVPPARSAAAAAAGLMGLLGPSGEAAAAGLADGLGATGGGGGANAGDVDAGQQRLHQLPDYLLFLALVRQERLPAAREEDAMRLYVSRLETHVEARIQACDKEHTDRLGHLVTAWMRAAPVGVAEDGGAASAAGGKAAPGPPPPPPASGPRSPRGGIASLQASFASLSALGSVTAAGGARGHRSAGAAGGKNGADEAEDDDDDDEDSLGDDLDEEGGTAEAEFLLWHGPAAAAAAAASSPFAAGSGEAKLPYHIRTVLPRLVQDPGGQRVATSGLYGNAAAAGVDGPLPTSAHAPEPVLTVAQRQWVSYVCSVSSLLLWSLPGLWATCNSPKYGSNADLDEQSKEALERGPSLARRLVESLCGKYAVRLRRAAQSLARAGPMQPGLPLIVKDACHLWRSLKLLGIGSRTLSGLRGAVLAVLGTHVGVLADHLGSLPQLLFGAEDFRLDLLATEQQPVTALPRRLEEEVGVALLHYQWPLRSVLDAAGGVEDVPPDSSWKPMQASVFACFSLLSEALAEYARGLHSGRGPEEGSGGSSFRERSTSGSLSSDLDQTSGGGAGGASPADVTAGAASMRRMAGPDASPRISMSLRRRASVGAASGPDSPGPSSEGGAGGGGATHGSLWAAVSGSSSDDVRMLLVISNSAVIRTRVMPGVVERYRKLMAPTPEATSICQRRLRDLTSAMRRSNEALGSRYLGRKEADVQAAVRRYVALAAAPLALLPADPSAPAATKRVRIAVGGGGGGARAAATPPLLPGPSGPSDGCCALLQLLTAIHNEALAYSPSNLLSFMEALVERLVGDLAPACQALWTAGTAGTGGSSRPARQRPDGGRPGSPSAAAAGSSALHPSGPAGGGTASVDQLVQVWADVEFLTAALRPLLTRSLAKELRGAQVALGGAVAAQQRARRYRPASLPAEAVLGLADGEAVSGALRDHLTPAVQEWLRRHALNVRCFASAAATASAAAAAGPEGAAPAAGDVASIDRSREGGGGVGGGGDGSAGKGAASAALASGAGTGGAGGKGARGDVNGSVGNRSVRYAQQQRFQTEEEDEGLEVEVPARRGRSKTDVARATG